MTIKELTKGIKLRCFYGKLDDEVSNLCHDSKHAKKGSAFVAIVGVHKDGHDYIMDAIKNGATTIITEKMYPFSLNVNQIVVDNTRKTLSLFASNFFRLPAQKLKIVGITGTNGKTTTSYMIAHILKSQGQKVGIIGTNGIYIEDAYYPNDMTTPDPIDLQMFFSKMVEKGMTYVIMEVSAHALYWDKLNGVEFQVAVFTNLSQDHLDFFHTMELYENAKLKLFTEQKTKYSIINIDDDFSKTIINCSNSQTITYGSKNSADYILKSTKNTQDDGFQDYILENKTNCYTGRLHMLGKFNLINMIGAIAVCNNEGVSMDDCVASMRSFDGVKGRFSSMVVPNHGIVIIDYAHTPDGLKNLLKNAKNECKGKLLCVFGCGGNRDKTKRPQMGKISDEIADYTIITTDNPRYEQPMQIIDDIRQGFKSKNFEIEVDRTVAIQRAFALSGPDDIVAICGKGSEPYMDIMGKKIDYSDFDVINNLILLENKKWEKE